MKNPRQYKTSQLTFHFHFPHKILNSERERQMKKRGKRKSSATELLVSPLPVASPSPNESPKSPIFNNNNTASSSKNNKKRPNAYSASTLFKSSPPNNITDNNNNAQKTLTSVSYLKDLTSSRLDDLKRNLIDRSHSQILNELEASHSCLHKRFKIQTQTCQQMMDEEEKEYKKMSERISESQEAMKASNVEFMPDARATASRVCKTSIPELWESFEKAIDVLQRRYGISSTFLN